MKLLKIGIFILYCFFVIYFVTNIKNINWLLVGGLFLPICSLMIVLLHELSHWLCFRLFGFCIKELRIGLFQVISMETPKIKIMDSGFFYGFCTIKRNTTTCNTKLIISLMAGGVSGLLASIISFTIIILNIASERWVGFFVSLFCVGIYSFYATLLSPRSADRKLIKEEFMK